MKNRIMPYILAILMVVSMLTVLTVNASAEEPAAVNDLNADGQVDISDVTTLLNRLAGSYSRRKAAPPDLNGDGAVDISDVTFLLNVLAGQGTAGLRYVAVAGGFACAGIHDTREEEVIIASTYLGKPVVGIVDYAFWDCWHLKKVTIPESVTVIGAEAFGGCSEDLEIIQR